MRHADSLGLPAWPSAPSLPGLPGLPVASRSSTAAYTPLSQEVTRDVQQFIAQGSSLSTLAQAPQAQWLALQAQRQLLRSEKKTESTGPNVQASGATRTREKAPSLNPQQQAFIEKITPWAELAAQSLGVSVRGIMAHAALETGWGSKPLKDLQGQDSLNLFGIKAGSGWSGMQTQALTTEYVEGADTKQVQHFRQYASLEATFSDYVNFLSSSPRYQAALHTGDDIQAFAQALARGGYATDPHYARKLVQVSQTIPVRP